MTRTSGFQTTLVPANLYRGPRVQHRVPMSAPVVEPVDTEGRYPTVLGILTGVYLVSVATMSEGTFEVSWVPQVVGITLGVTWLTVGLMMKGQPIKWSWPISCYILYSVWVMTGLLVTINVTVFMTFFMTQLKVALITWVCLQCVQKRRDLLVCFLLLGVASVVVMVQGLDSIIYSIEYAGKRGAKVREGTELFSNANGLGQFGVVVLIGATACIMSYKNTIMRLICCGFIFVTLYIIAASGSRTAMLGVVVFAAAIYWFHFRKAGAASAGRKVVLVFLSLFVLAGSVLFVAKLPFFYRLQEVFSSTENLRKEPRVEYFFRALASTAQHPVVGLGLGGFAMARLGVNAKHEGHYSHSTVSETLSCTGIPGFAIYFGTLVAIYKLLRRTRELPLPKADMATVNVIMSLFWVFMLFTAVSMMDSHRLFWPLIGAILGYIWSLNNKYSQSVPQRVTG